MIRHRRTYHRRERRRVPYFSFDSPGSSDDDHQSENDRLLNQRVSN